MAIGGSRFDDQSYKNWLRDTLALMYTKEGLESFSDAQSKLFHTLLLNSCGTGTSRCNSGCNFNDINRDARNQRWYMKCTLCNKWLASALSYHSSHFPKLSPDNTDPQKWHTVHWETSKLFMPYGCREDTCAKDSDIQGILSLFINSQYFLTGGHIGRADLLDKLVEIRNALFHSGSFQVSDTVVNEHFHKMIDFLQGMTGLTGSLSQTIQEAVLKIQELQANRLDLSLNKELELRALQQRQIGLEREMGNLENKVESLKKEQDNHGTKLNSTDIEIKQHDVSIKELKGTMDKFEEFLRANNLNDDIAGLSTQLQKVKTQLSTQKQEVEARLSTQKLEVESRLSTQKLDVESQLSTQKQEVQTQLKAQEEKFDQLGDKVYTLEERIKSTPDIPVSSSSKTWENQCKHLQQVLIDHYKVTCLIVQNPADSNEIGMEYLCVDPAIRVVRQSKGRDGLQTIKETATSFSCRKIFFNEEYKSREIYITGEAGSGKSMMCKTLVRLWCEAHGEFLSSESESSESDSDKEPPFLFLKNRKEERRRARKQRHEERNSRRQENREILLHFNLLFYITLRDSPSEYSVNEMIQSQILNYHSSVKGLSASVLLSNERCLVIVDGLDEWVCPPGAHVPPFLNSEIPGRDLFNKNNVFLTTTRPWKFDILQLKGLKVDKHVELCELNEQSASQLCSKVVKLLNNSQLCKKTKSEFFRKLEDKGLGHFNTIPIILIQLICLWFDNQELCKSQIQLYCAMLDLLLKKSQKNLFVPTTNSPKSAASKTSLPKCIVDHPYCQNHQQLIYCLSRVAFEALFDKRKENSLVFLSSQLEIYGVGQESIDLCLKSGILSQNKVLEKCSLSEKKMSFLHKKFQEFLAAIFLASCDDIKDIVKHIIDVCSTLETCLEMSQVWLFVSGIKPDITRMILDHLAQVVTDDKKVTDYRQTTGLIAPAPHFIRDIQTCIADCVIEGGNNDHTYDNMVLEDFYIDRNTVCHVEHLLPCTSRSNVKSMYINTVRMTDDAQLTSTISQLQHCQSVQKLHLDDLYPSRIDTRTIAQIVHKNVGTLTCLHLNSGITATTELVTDICTISTKCLMALRLQFIRLTHEHIEQLLTRLTKSPTIRQLTLTLHCTDHGRQCGASIDLSSMTHIQILVLEMMLVDSLQSVSHCIEHIRMKSVTLSVTTLCEFARRLSQTKRDVTVTLYDVTVTNVRERGVDMETFLGTCHELKVKRCQYKDSDDTWSIEFTRKSQ